MTVNDMIHVLEERVEKEPWVGDMIVTSIHAPSYQGIQTGKKPSEKLIWCQIVAQKEDESLQTCIVVKENDIVRRLIERKEGEAKDGNDNKH